MLCIVIPFIYVSRTEVVPYITFSIHCALFMHAGTFAFLWDAILQTAADMITLLARSVFTLFSLLGDGVILWLIWWDLWANLVGKCAKITFTACHLWECLCDSESLYFDTLYKWLLLHEFTWHSNNWISHLEIMYIYKELISCTQYFKIKYRVSEKLCML